VKREKQIGKQRQRRRFRVRNRVRRDSIRPRLSVFRSHKHTYAQIIDDDGARTLVAASTRDKQVSDQCPNGGNVDAAKTVGKMLAERALAAGIKEVALDRREYKYHGRIAALADAAREGGLVL